MRFHHAPHNIVCIFMYLHIYRSTEDPNASVACTGNQVKVAMTSAPVTLQDLLFIKGNSLVSNCGKNLVHSKPGIAGLVGLGKVAEVGSNVKHVKASDNIIVSQTGAWTSKGKRLWIK